jgi:hypothetical protein
MIVLIFAFLFKLERGLDDMRARIEERERESFLPRHFVISVSISRRHSLGAFALALIDVSDHRKVLASCARSNVRRM